MNPAGVVFEGSCVKALPIPRKKMIKKDIGDHSAVTAKVPAHEGTDLAKDRMLIGKAVDFAVEPYAFLNPFVQLREFTAAH